MRALIQRVNWANVTVEKDDKQKVVGEIGQGILAYIGISHHDDLATAKKMIDKILTYRIFENTEDVAKAGKLDWSVQQARGSLLLVSQFTLMANTSKGRRPDFADAMSPVAAKDLFTELVEYANSCYESFENGRVAKGEFGAMMQVSAENNGPLNFILEV